MSRVFDHISNSILWEVSLRDQSLNISPHFRRSIVRYLVWTSLNLWFLGVLRTQDFQSLTVHLLLSIIIVTEHGVPLDPRLVDRAKGSLGLRLETNTKKSSHSYIFFMEIITLILYTSTVILQHFQSSFWWNEISHMVLVPYQWHHKLVTLMSNKSS